MAQYHYNVAICNGGTGAAVASAAYQSGQEMTDDLGRTKKYKNTERVIYTNLLAPDNAPAWAADRETLWKEVERREGMRGQYARKYNIALPCELSVDQQIELADQIAEYYRSRGMCVDYAVHQDLDPKKPADQRNPHLHIMTTMRAFNQDGTWAQKSKTIMLRDRSGKLVKIGRDKNGKMRYRQRKIKLTNWDDKDELINQRKMVADLSNAALAKAGFSARVDHRTYLDQGILKIPTKHLGHANAAKERRGVHTPPGDYNRHAMEINNSLLNTKNSIVELDKKIERIDKYVRKQRSNEIARKRAARNRRQQAAVSIQSFAAERIKMYYVHKRMVAAYGNDRSKSFSASKPDMFVHSKRQRAGMVGGRSGQDRDTRLPVLQLVSWSDLNRSERQVLLNEFKKDSNWVFATDAAKYNMSQRAMFVRNGGRLAMYPLCSGVSHYKPGDNITAQDLQADCRAAYANSSAGRDAGRALKSAADSVCAFFDQRKKPKDHLKAAAKSVKDAAQAPVKIVQDVISNPIAGLLKAPLRIASAASSAASAATHTVAAAVKTGISKSGDKANTAASGGGFSSHRGSSRDDDDWDNLLTDADKAERREKQLYRI